MCFNNLFSGGNTNSIVWLILIILVLGGGNSGCGCIGGDTCNTCSNCNTCC
ncbi:MAG: hypothetical protein IKM51_05195 [Oscillospiraceae bacterium]|nr:hypothetical protein [Oscillospiraceae bacterium]